MTIPTTPAENTAKFLSLMHFPGDRLFISTNLPKWRRKELQAEGLPVEGWKDRPFDDVLPAATYAQRKARTHDVYHSTGVFFPGATRRLADNVRCSRVARIDVDVKDGAYAATEDSISALMAFGRWLVPPTLVVGSSGTVGGLHAYWVFTEPVLADTLRMIYAKLDMATAKFGLVTDTQCTVDLARVLRPLGTINHKRRDTPQPVILLDRSGTPITPDKFKCALDAALARESTSPVAVPAAVPISAAKPRTGAKSTTKFVRRGGLNPLAFCPQLSKSLSERGANDGYVVWRCCLQFAKTYSDDSAEQLDLGVRLSDGHPGFSRGEVEKKLKGLHSPPLCTTLNQERKGICTMCRSWGTIQSPVTLWLWEPVQTPDRKRAIDDEVATFKDGYRNCLAQGLDPVTALQAACGRTFLGLKARDPDLARDCAFKLMAFVAREWSERVVLDVGTVAGLDDALAARWAAKLARRRKRAPPDHRAEREGEQVATQAME